MMRRISKALLPTGIAPPEISASQSCKHSWCDPEFVGFLLRILAADHCAFQAVTIAPALSSMCLQGRSSGTAIPAASRMARDFGPSDPTQSISR